MKQFFDIIASKSGVTVLLKVAIALAALYLLSLMEVANIALPIDIESHKLKYAVEYELKTEISFSELECSFEMETYQDCKLAKYSNEITSNSLEVLYSFQKIIIILFCLTSSLLVFVSIFSLAKVLRKNCNRL